MGFLCTFSLQQAMQEMHQQSQHQCTSKKIHVALHFCPESRLFSKAHQKVHLTYTCGSGSSFLAETSDCYCLEQTSQVLKNRLCQMQHWHHGSSKIVSFQGNFACLCLRNENKWFEIKLTASLFTVSYVLSAVPSWWWVLRGAKRPRGFFFT